MTSDSHHQPKPLRSRIFGAIVLLVLLATGAWGVAAVRDIVVATPGGVAPPLELPPIPEASPATELDTTLTVSLGVPDSLRGISRALQFKTLTAAEALEVPGFLEGLGERAIRTPAAHRVRSYAGADFTYLVLRPFGEKRGDRLNGYRLGVWPAERWITARNYFNPDGFVEVYPSDTGVRLSRHFTLGDFLTHDQREIWPKYVVLEERLIDKLELVMQHLNAASIPTSRVIVLSGFRAPYYNDRGAGEGMARTSRHQYGDAADIIVDDDSNGRMDDLNRDGRIDLRDTGVITRAIAAVEAMHPSLVGGLGTYTAMGPRGPFAHIDVRGTSARWENRSKTP